jgi:hypothetical protein
MASCVNVTSDRIPSLVVGLTDHDVQQATLAAGLESSSGPYGRRSANRQQTGRLGERAFERWITGVVGTAPRRAYYGYDTDFAVEGHTFEVKTLRDSTWATHGAVISAYQLPRIIEHSQYVVFLRLPDQDPPPTAEVVGWVRPLEVAERGSAFVTDDLLAQISLPRDALRDPAELVRLARQPPPLEEPTPRLDRDCVRCARSTVAGFCWHCCPWPARHPRLAWVTKSGHRLHPVPGPWLRLVHPDWPRGNAETFKIERVIATKPPCLRCLDALDAGAPPSS